MHEGDGGANLGLEVNDVGVGVGNRKIVRGVGLDMHPFIHSFIHSCSCSCSPVLLT